MAGRILLFVLPLFDWLSIGTADWSYNASSVEGPSHWQETYSSCGGQSQSPIDISSTAAISNEMLRDFTFVGYDTIISQNFILHNNGHSFQVNLPVDTVYIEGGGLANRYDLEQFHFHWGKDDNEGSEHLINGKAYPLEVHLVHRAHGYPSVSAALVDPQGVAVVGVFVDVNCKDISKQLGDLTADFKDVEYEGDSTEIAPFSISSLLPKSRGYYRYNGSLTTPGCNESVIWTLYTNPICITDDQMKEFRTMHGDGDALLLENFRPPQALNGRIVYRGSAPPLVQPLNGFTTIALAVALSLLV